MAHPCFHCGGECYCHGDIDDIVTSETPANCSGCDCDIQWAGDEDEDDDDDYEPVGYECFGCMKGSCYPGDCPICGNPLEPYG